MPLPLPGSPSATWSLSLQRLKSSLSPADLRITTSFWLFGLINNIFYVIILTSALDLVGPAVPKATVLLACIIPGLATKILTPYIIHLVPYSLRIVIFVGLATCGMLAVALSPSEATAASISWKIAGIVLANISSGAGEVSFLGLVHFYGEGGLAAWGSGTGAAGLIGAGAYALATTQLNFSVHATLLSSTVLPLIMLFSYFILLPLEPLHRKEKGDREYQPIPSPDDEDDVPAGEESAGLLAQPENGRSVSPAYQHKRGKMRGLWFDMSAKLERAKGLFIPYMLPLFLVYLAEYTINQGIAPTLLFPLEETPFKNFRSFYPTYSTIYQLGVFASRSSLPFLRIKSLYIPTFLQIANFFLLLFHALYPVIPNVYIVFAIIFWEGLLGGLVYVSTFAAVREEVEEKEREFSLGAVTVSDSAGIFGAGIFGSVLEGVVCAWQVRRGRGWCRML